MDSGKIFLALKSQTRLYLKIGRLYALSQLLSRQKTNDKEYLLTGSKVLSGTLNLLFYGGSVCLGHNQLTKLRLEQPYNNLVI